MKLPGWLLRDRLGRRGIAAVEFALVMPILLVMFIGTIEVLTLYRTEGKLNALAFNVAQMVATEATPVVLSTGSPETGTSLNDICQGAILGLQPFPPAGLTIAVASVTLESGPNGLPASSSAYSKTATYDVWEGDSTVAGQTCTTSAGSQIGAGNAETLATTPAAGGASGNTGMLEDPCDNAIVVQATLKYPGLTGLIIRSAPTLTQTAYARWSYAALKTELTCPTCTVSNAATQVCNSSNAATN